MERIRLIDLIGVSQVRYANQHICDIYQTLQKLAKWSSDRVSDQSWAKKSWQNINAE